MPRLYPISVAIRVHVTDGKLHGTAEYICPLNRLPTDEDMPEILKQVTDAMPGFRLMSRHESMMHFLREDKHYRGPTLALDNLADGEEWHDPETANTYAYSDDGSEEDEE